MKTTGSKNPVQLHPKIQNFLLTYRSTPHATTHVSPAKLFLNREVHTRLSLIKPDLAQTVASEQSKMKSYFDQHTKFRQFAPGDQVLARDFTSPPYPLPYPPEKWQPGEVLQQSAPYSYSVQLKDGRVWIRHVNHFISGVPNLQLGESKSQSSLVSNSQLRSDASDQHPAHPQPPRKSGTDDRSGIDAPVTTRSGRIIERPNRFNNNRSLTEVMIF